METGLCKTCAAALEPVNDCPVCGALGARGLCAACLKGPLSCCRFAFYYEEGVRRLVMRYKFSGEKYLARALAPYLLPLLPTGFGLLVPVPLHKKRLRERGYNQAAELARVLSAESGLPFCEALVKTRATRVQSGLSREERLHNLADVFAAGKEVAGQRVILIDDVFTTGATLSACAAALLAAGAEKTAALTVAYRAAK